MLRSRTRLVRSCASRTAAGTLSAFSVCSRTTPSTVSPCRAWKRRTAGLDVGIVDVGHAGVGVEIAGQRQPLAQRRRPPDGGCRAAAGRPAPPPASRPWRRCPRTARSPARCAARSQATASAATPSASGWCASRNRSPGRNRCPGSGRSAPAAPRPGRRRGRRARCHRPRPRSAERRAGSDGAGQAMWSLQFPKPQTPNSCRNAFSRSQSAALASSDMQ